MFPYLFFFFSFTAIFSSFMVISVRNPVHSILYLIIVFLNTSALFFILGVEFLAILFLIVYVGAIAILFLFVVMMLNIKLISIKDLYFNLPIGSLIALLFLFEIFFILDSHFPSYTPLTYYFNWDEYIYHFSNIHRIGLILYTDYFFFFIVAAYILLVAMIGAILLTHQETTNVKRQEVLKQTSTTIIP